MRRIINQGISKIPFLLNCLFLLIFLNLSFLPAATFASQMPEFICENGIKFYQEGRYDEALEEFKKALMIEPDYAPALKYIRMIEQIRQAQEKETQVVPAEFEPSGISSPERTKEITDLIELQKEMVMERKLRPAAEPFSPVPSEVKFVKVPAEKKKKEIPNLIALDESLSAVKQPIEIEQGTSVMVIGKNIQRFLVTQPDILSVEKKGPNELFVTGKQVGYTYLHIWDDSGRWTTEWLGLLPKPEGPTYDELMRREEEKARNFKLRYALDWYTFQTGKGFRVLGRSSYSFSHNLALFGPTPYGDIDSSINIQTMKDLTDLTYATLGLTKGQIGPFKGFAIRGFDYFTNFTNLAFPNETLRGVMLESPAFDGKINYTTFWGREGGGRYGNLSPILYQVKSSFLGGLNLQYLPTEKQTYKFNVIHAWGKDRDKELRTDDFDLMGNWNLDKGGLGYELAYDSKKYAHLFNARYTQPKINLNAEIRNIDKDFLSITGRGWRQGELGTMVNADYRPTDKVLMRSTLDVFQDRLSPAQDNPNRWNEDFTWDANYQFDPVTNAGLNYTLQNELGRISQYRYQAGGINAGKKFRFFKDISTYLNYYHQENKNYTSHASDYINEKVNFGLRFSLIGALYYYANEEYNWLKERYYATHSEPNVFETGLDWSEQIGTTPFYGTMRFTYHNEEDSVSNLAFLSGEDYIEGYTELRYRATPDNEIYGTWRVRNTWADNPNVLKRFDMDFSAGLRYLWDTGARWTAVGNIEGYIFRDLNSDGLRQRDEPPVEGIKIWLGKDKYQVTDLFGYYKFKGVKARKVYVTLDTSTLPRGFVLTVPVTQETGISNFKIARIDFGINCRSEISGAIFDDTNDNGEYDREDKGVAGVVMTLENGNKATTDNAGRYTFSSVSPGEHIVSMDLSTLPFYYLPKSAITKKVMLFEGITYIYNIPLKRIKK